MFVPTSVDYAVRAMVELAVAYPARLSREELARRQDIPTRYLEAILGELARVKLVLGRRGPAGGYELGRHPAEINVADIHRALEGRLVLVGQQRPDEIRYEGTAVHVGELWVGLRSAIRAVLETVTLAHLASGELPPSIAALVSAPDAWLPRP